MRDHTRLVTVSDNRGLNLISEGHQVDQSQRQTMLVNCRVNLGRTVMNLNGHRLEQKGPGIYLIASVATVCLNIHCES